MFANIKTTFRDKKHNNLEISTFDPLKYTMGISYLLYQYVWENPSEYKGLYQDTS